MLCCFGRPAGGQKQVSLAQADPGPVPTTKAVEQEPADIAEATVPPPPTEQKLQHQPATDVGECFDGEPWRAKLSRHLVSLVSNSGIRAASCWVCTEDRAKCVLLAAAPSTAGNSLRSLLSGNILGSAVDLEHDTSSSVSDALSSKAPVSATVLPNGHVQGEMPADLRQLYDRLCRSAGACRSDSSIAPMTVWHMVTLPLVVRGTGVGVLVTGSQLDVSFGTALNEAIENATAERVAAAESLAQEVFSVPAALDYARHIASLAVGVSSAPDHTSSVRDTALQIDALLQLTGLQPSKLPRPELVVTMGLVTSRPPTRAASPGSGAAAVLGPTAATALANANATPSCAATGAPGGSGAQLHLYWRDAAKAPTTLVASETLIMRAPIRADALAAMLSEALAAPVSSAALAAAAAAAAGGTGSAGGGSVRGATSPSAPQNQQQQQQKLLMLRCPEDELPASQPRADLAALEAAGVRAPRGSVVLVSCPLPSIMCAVVVYVCVAPPGAVQDDRAVQLSEAQLQSIMKQVSSAAEVLASALEQRMLSSCAPSAARLGSRGMCAVDVTADVSGQVTVSLACTDGDDSNGFWGSASGPILSGESIPTTHLAAVAGNIAVSPSASGAANCISFARSPDSRPLHGMQLCARSLALHATGMSAGASPLGTGNFPGGSQHGTRAELPVSNTEGGPVVGSPCYRPVTEVPANGSDKPSAPTTKAGGAAGSAAGLGEADSGNEPCAGPSAGKDPAAGQPIVTTPTNDTDVSQDIAMDGAGAHTTASGLHGGSTSGTTTSSGSGADGVESTIKALTCSDIQTASTGVASNSMPAGACKPGAAAGGMQTPESPATLQKHAAHGPAHVFLPLRVPQARRAAGVRVVIDPLGAQESPSGGEVVTGAAAAAPLPAAAAASGGGTIRPHGALEGAVVLAPAGVGSTGGSVIIGAGSVSGNSMEQVSRAMVRNRSKDWSDQTVERDPVEAKLTSAPAPRVRPIKVLSLDKAAQQLQRSQGASVGGVVMQPAPQQQGYPVPLQPGSAAQQEGMDGGTHLPLPPSVTTAGAAPTAGSTAAAPGTAGGTAAAPPPYVPYMPRRLNRMYLPQGPGTTGGPGSMSVIGAGVVGTAPRMGAPLVGTPPAAALPSASAAVQMAALQPSLMLSAQPQSVHVNGRAIMREGDTASSGSAPGLIARVAVGPQLPAAHQLSSAPAPNATNATVQRVTSVQRTPADPAPRDVSRYSEKSTFPVHGPQPAAGVSTPLAPPAGPVTMTRPFVLPPSPVAAAAAAALARVEAAATSTGAVDSPSPSASGQKSRQLSDYAIPEDAPLEYNVSETVHMMRALAQARGVHLSSRMRRVRITAKIQSAHPESLPVDLPSQLAKAALGARPGGSGGSGGLFAGLGPGMAATLSGGGCGGAWMLTSVAARRGCVELVFDMVQVLGGSAGANAGLNFENLYHLEASAGSAASARRRPPAQAVVTNIARVDSLQLSDLSGNRSAAAAAGTPSAPGPSNGTGPSSGSTGSGAQGSQAGTAGPAIQSTYRSSGSHGYRRWQGPGADSLSDLLGLGEEMDELAAMQQQHQQERPAPVPWHGSGGGKAPSPAAAGEQFWLRSLCGVRPEGVAEVLQSCGLLSPGNDPFVDIQVGHTAAGAATVAWDEASGQWVTATASGAAAPPVLAPVAEPLEAPTLWLPSAVALLARGARVLQDIRIVSTPGSGGIGYLDVLDEVTVRSSSGYLPVRVAAGLRMHAGGGSGASVPPLPLLLEDDPVAEALAEGTCCWRLMDVGGMLPRNGGMLLVECRRSPVAATAGAPGGVAGAAAAGGASAGIAGVPAVTSAPVPLLVLPERHAAAAAELQRLRVYMARMLLGSEDVLRANATTGGHQLGSAAGGSSGAAAAVGSASSAAARDAAARASAAAQVEMASQQFLLDLGTLVDAAARAGGAPPPANTDTATMTGMASPAPLAGTVSCPQASVASAVGLGPSGPPPHSFSGGQFLSGSKRPIALPELQISPMCTTEALSSMPSCSSPLTMMGGASVPERAIELTAAWMSSEAGGHGTAFAASVTSLNAGWDLASDMRGLMQVHQAAVAPSADVDVAEGSGGAAAAAAGAAFGDAGDLTAFGEHLVDVACTVLAGCCAAGMMNTALLALQLACGELALAGPEVLLAEAGADPQVSLELLAAYAAHARQRCAVGQAAAAAVTEAAPRVPGEAPASEGSGQVLTVRTVAGPEDQGEPWEDGGPGATGGPSCIPRAVTAPTEIQLFRGEAEWSGTTDGIVAPNSTQSRSHSLAVMLTLPRSSLTSPMYLQERGALETSEGGAALDFSGWHRSSNLGTAASQQAAAGAGAAEAGPQGLDRQMSGVQLESVEGEDGLELSCEMDSGVAGEEVDEEEVVVERPAGRQHAGEADGSSMQGTSEASAAAVAAAGARTDGPRAVAEDDEDRPGAAPAAGSSVRAAPQGLVCVDVSQRQSFTSDALPTWGSVSLLDTPNTVTRSGSRSAPGSNLLASVDMAAIVAAARSGEAQSPRGAGQSGLQAVTSATVPDAATSSRQSGAVSPSACPVATASPSGSGSARASGFRSSPKGSGSGGSSPSPRPGGAACSTASPQAREEAADSEACYTADRRTAAAAAACHTGPCGGGDDDDGCCAAPATRALQEASLGSPWALRFPDPALEAEYRLFVATRTRSFLWSYFICNVLISLVSCTRACLEDGMGGCLTLLFFSGGQAAIMGWYCLARSGEDPDALVAAAVACKAVRVASDVLMGLGILEVPSLMENMSKRAVEIWAEGMLRPLAERVPIDLFCFMALAELPCIWLLYSYFQTIYPQFWLRGSPLLRALSFFVLHVVVNILAELYWRREFRRWFRGRAAAESCPSASAWVAAGEELAPVGGASHGCGPLCKACD